MVLVQTVVIGSLYALIAIGFTLIFGVGGVFNLAHGGFITLGGYVAFYIIFNLGYSPLAGLVAGTVATGVFAGALYWGVIRYVEDSNTVLILTLIVSFVIVFLAVSLSNLRFSLPVIVDGTVLVGGSRIQQNLLVALALSLVLIGLLFAFVNYTRPGKAVLAVSMSQRGARLAGIDPTRVNLVTWTLAGAFAGCAGVFIGMQFGGGVSMGWSPMVISFAIVILGGLGSIRGSLVGAYIISAIEVLTIQINPRLSGVSSLLVLVVVLLLRPEGLFGRGEEA